VRDLYTNCDDYDAQTYQVQILPTWVSPDCWGAHIKVRRYDGADGIPWDDLWRIKNAVAGREALAIEVYPPLTQLVASENIRHLWVISDPVADRIPNLMRGTFSFTE